MCKRGRFCEVIIVTTRSKAGNGGDSWKSQRELQWAVKGCRAKRGSEIREKGKAVGRIIDQDLVRTEG